jgi:hypothetical protein
VISLFLIFSNSLKQYLSLLKAKHNKTYGPSTKIFINVPQMAPQPTPNNTHPAQDLGGNQNEGQPLNSARRFVNEEVVKKVMAETQEGF